MVIIQVVEHWMFRFLNEAEIRWERTGEDLFAKLPFDPYAAENPGELFAVMSETFFEEPDILREVYPALYARFCSFYRQDPLNGQISIS